MVLKIPLYPEERAAENARVCVTGATGFVAGHIIERLLVSGHTVHGTVRDLNNEELLAALKALPGASQRLIFFEADLQQPGSFDEALRGCKYVLHTASPFFSPEKQADVRPKLVDPAVNGTRNVLESAKKCDSVRRVVLTSSCGAVYSDCHQKGEGVPFNENDWADTVSEERLPAHYVKRRAEEIAREIADSQSRWDLVTINPSLVIGPPIGRRSDGKSLSFLSKLFTGKFEHSPKVSLGVVDVRDVAAAHCLAMVHPKAKGRYICSEGTYSLFDCGKFIQEKFPNQKVPQHVVPSWVLGLPGMGLMGVRQDFVDTHVDKVPRFDSSKIQRELGFKFHSSKYAFQDMATKMCEMGLLSSSP